MSQKGIFPQVCFFSVKRLDFFLKKKSSIKSSYLGGKWFIYAHPMLLFYNNQY